MIQHKVILGIAVLFWATRYEHVIVPEEVLQAGNLEEDRENIQMGLILSEIGSFALLQCHLVRPISQCILRDYY